MGMATSAATPVTIAVPMTALPMPMGSDNPGGGGSSVKMAGVMAPPPL